MKDQFDLEKNVVLPDKTKTLNCYCGNVIRAPLTFVRIFRQFVRKLY